MMTEKTTAGKALMRAVTTWFTVVFLGQAIFALYILGLYGISTLTGNLQKWNNATPHGYVPNDLTGNIFFGLHMALAAIITLGGPINLLPWTRRRIPRFHRINGRVYIIAAYLTSLAGLYLSWVRGSVGGIVGSVFISIDAVLIMISATFTIRYAMARDIERHNRWAIRLFLAMSGVWFFRVCLMLWLAIFQRPVGFDPDTFQGPFLTVLYVLVYVLPIGFAQLFFLAREASRSWPKWAMAAFLFILSAGMAVGALVASVGMWWPQLTR